jgi:hypothetical protein
MNRLCIWMDESHLKRIKKIGKAKELKTAQVIRLAMADFIRKEEPKQ